MMSNRPKGVKNDERTTVPFLDFFGGGKRAVGLTEAYPPPPSSSLSSSIATSTIFYHLSTSPKKLPFLYIFDPVHGESFT